MTAVVDHFGLEAERATEPAVARVMGYGFDRFQQPERDRSVAQRGWANLIERIVDHTLSGRRIGHDAESSVVVEAIRRRDRLLGERAYGSFQPSTGRAPRGSVFRNREGFFVLQELSAPWPQTQFRLCSSGVMAFNG